MCKQTLFIVYIMCTSNPIPWSFEMSWYITSFCDHQSVLPTRTPLSSDSTELTSNSIHPGKGRASARGRGVENPQLSSEKKTGCLDWIGDYTIHLFGQIIATSHDLTPNGGLVMEFPLFQGNLSW